MGSRFISFGVYLRIPEVVDAGRMPLPRHVLAAVCGDTKMRSRCGYHALATFFVNPEESSSGQNMRETPRRKDLDLEKYPPAFAAANVKYHATGAGNPQSSCTSCPNRHHFPNLLKRSAC